MDIKKLDKQLKKVNTLVDSLRDEESISSIEKDLLLSYIRNLYEKVLHIDNDGSEKVVIKQKKAPQPVYEPPVIEQEYVAPAPPEPTIIKEPIVSEPIPEPTPVEVPVVQAIEETIEVVEGPSFSIPGDLQDLFMPSSVNELSDKLSNAPIRDLTSAMGINEKIFTINELFGGDSTLFNDSMKTLDGYSSLNEARDYLVEHVAVKNDWSDAGKIKKAANFIKLISRRYN